MTRGLGFLITVAGFGVGLLAAPAQAVQSHDWVQHALDQAMIASPGVARGAVVVRCGAPAVTALAGQARAGRASPLSPDARFNIGSNAKSMLASLAATFIVEGRLSWTTQVQDVFAAEAGSLDPVLRHATLGQLLSHRSGAPAYSAGADLSSLAARGDTASAQRLDVALQILRGPPAYVPDSQAVYSNAGYIIVGAMLERVGEQSFETLMRDRLFGPLGMDHATFGDPTADQVGQPLGHRNQDGVRTVYLDDEPAIPAFLQPAGDVSLTLHDYGLYLREHLCGLRDGPTRLLPAPTVHVLHRPQGDGGMALGWGAYAFNDAPASVHVGGTGVFSAFVAIIPSQDLAVATVVNAGDEEARTATLGLLRALVAQGMSPAAP